MNRFASTVFWVPVLLLLLRSGGLGAQPALVPELQSQRVFGAGWRQISVRWRNTSDHDLEYRLRGQLFQAALGTAAPMGEYSGPLLQVHARQTIIEFRRLDFPAVRAETRFLIQWLEDANNLLGVTEVLVYPTNLLAELQPLAGEEPLGILDPTDGLKPLLRSLAVEFQDFATHGTGGFQGRLAIFGPFAAADQMREGLAAEIRALAKRGVAVVWLQPPREPRAPLKPSFYTVREGDGAIVVAQHEMAAHLAENPEAQLNLLRLAERALRPELLDLPETGNSN